MNLELDFALDAIGGELLAGNPSMVFSDVSTDSRSIGPGELFIALDGENFDGHDFVEAALNNGASGVIAATSKSNALLSLFKDKNAALVSAPDTLMALGDLADAWRSHINPKVVAITGSSGKTGTRNMTAAILGKQFETLLPESNFNNLIGLPLTLLRLRSSHEVAVLELGMNHKGEIERLTEICHPDIALITNVGPAHLEFFNSIDDIADAKGELFREVLPTATIILNMDDERVIRQAEGLSNPRVGFGVKAATADVFARDIAFEGVEGMRFVLNIRGDERPVVIKRPGEHNVINAVAAAATATAFGMSIEDIVSGLAATEAPKMRMQIEESGEGVNVINDAYNANPESVKAAIKTLHALRGLGKAVVALGDMRELGAESDRLHQEVGEFAAQAGVSHVFALGEWAESTISGARLSGMGGESVKVFPNHESMAKEIQSFVDVGDWVLVKGSRLAKMETLVDILMKKSEE